MTEKKIEDYLNITAGRVTIDDTVQQLPGLAETLDSEGFEVVYVKTTVYFQPKTDAV